MDEHDSEFRDRPGDRGEYVPELARPNPMLAIVRQQADRDVERAAQERDAALAAKVAALALVATKDTQLHDWARAYKALEASKTALLTTLDELHDGWRGILAEKERTILDLTARCQSAATITKRVVHDQRGRIESVTETHEAPAPAPVPSAERTRATLTAQSVLHLALASGWPRLTIGSLGVVCGPGPAKWADVLLRETDPVILETVAKALQAYRQMPDPR